MSSIMKRSRPLASFLVVVATLIAMAANARAATFTETFSGTGTAPDDSDQIAFTAQFTLNTTAQTLTIVLSDTGAPATDQADVLTALLFNGPSFTSGVATLTGESSLVHAGDTSGTIGSNWQYIPGNGLGSTGVFNFGPSGNLDGSNHTQLDGSGFGILSAATTSADALLDGLASREYVQNSITFTLSSVTLPNLSSITSVIANYGTSNCDRHGNPHCNRNCDGDADRHCDRDRDSDRNLNSQRHADRNRDANSHRDCHSHADRHRYGDARSEER